MQDKHFTEARGIRSAQGLVISLGPIFGLSLLALAILAYMLGVSAVYAGTILVAALVASILTRRFYLDFSSFRIAFATSDIVGQCPYCVFVITMPRSAALISCPECMRWIRILGLKLFKVGSEEALLLAAEEGLTDTVKVLLSEGANVDAKDRTGSTVLQRAICGGYIGTVRLLLAAGANVNAKGDDNSTPLIGAVMLGRSELVKELLKAGADVNAKNDAGLTSLRIALDRRFTGVAELLKEAGSKLE